MSQKTANLGQTFGALLGTVTQSATLITDSLDSVAALSHAGNVKAHEFLHATRVRSATNKNRLTKIITMEACADLSNREIEIQKQLDSNPQLKSIFTANMESCLKAVAHELGVEVSNLA